MPGVSVVGENSFYRETRGTRRGGRHVVKRSSDPRVAHPEVKVQVRDLVRVVGILHLLPLGCSVSGENWFIEPKKVDGHRRLVSGTSSSGTPRESQAKFRDGTVWLL